LYIGIGIGIGGTYVLPAVAGWGPTLVNPADAASLMAILSIVSDTVAIAFPKGSHASLPAAVYMSI